MPRKRSRRGGSAAAAGAGDDGSPVRPEVLAREVSRFHPATDLLYEEDDEDDEASRPATTPVVVFACVPRRSGGTALLQTWLGWLTLDAVVVVTDRPEPWVDTGFVPKGLVVLVASFAAVLASLLKLQERHRDTPWRLGVVVDDNLHARKELHAASVTRNMARAGDLGVSIFVGTSNPALLGKYPLHGATHVCAAPAVPVDYPKQLARNVFGMVESPNMMEALLGRCDPMEFIVGLYRQADTGAAAAQAPPNHLVRVLKVDPARAVESIKWTDAAVSDVLETLAVEGLV